jgi:hypothetical protein
MKTYSVIELHAPLPEINVDNTVNFTSIMKRYDPDFNIINLFPTNFQGKIYGWTTHLDLVSRRVVIFVLINPIYNFFLLKNLYDEFETLNQYGFVFDANNININQAEHERIFGGMEKGTTEIELIDSLNLYQSTHL